MIVGASGAPEDAELADVLAKLQRPRCLTLADLIDCADLIGHEDGFSEWLRDRRNRRRVGHRLESAGYVSVQNPDAKSGLWVVNGRRQVVYALNALPARERLAAAQALASRSPVGQSSELPI